MRPQPATVGIPAIAAAVGPPGETHNDKADVR